MKYGLTKNSGCNFVAKQSNIAWIIQYAYLYFYHCNNFKGPYIFIR